MHSPQLGAGIFFLSFGSRYFSSYFPLSERHCPKLPFSLVAVCLIEFYSVRCSALFNRADIDLMSVAVRLFLPHSLSQPRRNALEQLYRCLGNDDVKNASARTLMTVKQ